jgi:hypothetical protein
MQIVRSGSFALSDARVGGFVAASLRRDLE